MNIPPADILPQIARTRRNLQEKANGCLKASAVEMIEAQ
jgi:hypothetical protein